MSSTWVTRTGEGLVVGITASVAFMIFGSMNDARVELGKARETLDLQLEVNQGLLDQTEELEDRLDQLERRLADVEDDVTASVDLDSLNEDVRVTGSAPSEVPVSPLANRETILEWAEPSAPTTMQEPPRTSIQHRIDQQKQITQ